MVLFITYLILLVLCLAFICGAFLFHFKGYFKNFYHDKLKWHYPIVDEDLLHNSDLRSVCKYCGTEIIGDDNGNWIER